MSYALDLCNSSTLLLGTNFYVNYLLLHNGHTQTQWLKTSMIFYFLQFCSLTGSAEHSSAPYGGAVVSSVAAFSWELSWGWNVQDGPPEPLSAFLLIIH